MDNEFTGRCHGVRVPDDAAYIAEVEDILANDAFRSMENYIQHGTTTCRDHCVWVSYRSYFACRKLGWNSRAAARAGLLHDLFLYDWHDKEIPWVEIHGFTHPRKAYENARRIFPLTRREKDLILKHMWPLTVVPPRYKEAYVLMHFDRMSSLHDTFHEKLLRPLRSFLFPLQG